MRSRTVANRTVLALTGLALLAAAGAAAGRVGNQVVDAALRQLRHAGPGPLILTACAALAASSVLLVAQVPRRAPRRLGLPAPGCHLDSRAVRRAVRTGCSAVPGVVRASCRLTGRGHTMTLAVTLTVDSTAHPGEVLSAVTHGVLTQFAALLAPRHLKTRIRLRVQRPRPRRAL
ncbi:hypothetical protein LG634_32215 [Streptomyces bambusae]|uniref:hypothetical protein n=1 Tax=Streptomyces bambusae TaxID=1550616 RepID=UPI001CFF936B|nr:hypothetical protein [Streptomyces bambusae]MCB5169460.1 hypothetical protein [Streptomyces bambusae]